MKKIIVSLFFTLCMSNIAIAQEAASIADTPLKEYDRNTSATLEHEGTDSLGARLAMTIKESLNTSSLFTLQEEDSPKFRIILETTPEFKDRPSVGSAYSIVWVFSQNESILGHYIGSEVGVFTSEDIDGLTAKILEQTDTYSVRYGYLFETSN